MCQFILNQIVPFEEGLTCEFKNISQAMNPVKSINRKVDEYVVCSRLP